MDSPSVLLQFCSSKSIARDWQNRAFGVAVGATAACVAWRLWMQEQAWPSKLKRDSPRLQADLKGKGNRKRVGHQSFPPPYPNGWMYICPSDGVRAGDVMPIDVCGRHLVLFRNMEGNVGVLNAFCPHMGTHLGYGGSVRGKTIVCPYHEWRFDTKGQLAGMPFGGRATAEKGATNCNATAYPTIERHGMILVWLHADGENPFTPEILDAAEGMRLICRLTDDFAMHCMEPAHNTADWYHFRTVHSALGQDWLTRFRFAHVTHTIHPARFGLIGSKDDDGKPIEKPHLMILDEQIDSMTVLGFLKVPQWIFSLIKTQVRFNGPCFNSFHISFPILGKAVIYMPIIPTEPFVTHCEFICLAERSWPWLFAYGLTWLVRRTVQQDRDVWEHRTHEIRNAVKGDYDYGAFFKWLDQFYSESSIGWDRAYEDLTW
eukprot:TRINITY_DN15582_c0_g1_i2.p1 TRINITY_DN15582_c0_g1~~TRINITY_DN15582_c0_g1_i2.p1  ORF type:complete len:431 (+),score=35.55 TRINITY_DN15582_c0_g1_i2:76-1368(+)